MVLVCVLCMIYQVMQMISEVLVEMKLRNEDDANSIAVDNDLC